MRQMLLQGDLTERIIGVFFQVHRELGPGFLESIYATRCKSRSSMPDSRLSARFGLRSTFAEGKSGRFAPT